MAANPATMEVFRESKVLWGDLMMVAHLLPTHSSWGGCSPGCLGATPPSPRSRGGSWRASSEFLELPYEVVVHLVQGVPAPLVILPDWWWFPKTFRHIPINSHFRAKSFFNVINSLFWVAQEPDYVCWTLVRTETFVYCILFFLLRQNASTYRAKIFPLPHEMPKVYCEKIWFRYVSIWSRDDDDIHSTDLPGAPCILRYVLYCNSWKYIQDCHSLFHQQIIFHIYKT